jgi:hypothetical protein
VSPGQETRYARDKRRQEQESRHNRIVTILSGDVIADFEAVRAKEGAKCYPTTQSPNPWVDWDAEPDKAEDYEGPMPTEAEAKALCDGCPLMVDHGGVPLCYAYARATQKSHGVYGGIRIYDGKRVGWGMGETR